MRFVVQATRGTFGDLLGTCLEWFDVTGADLESSSFGRAQDAALKTMQQMISPEVLPKLPIDELIGIQTILLEAVVSTSNEKKIEALEPLMDNVRDELRRRNQDHLLKGMEDVV